MKEVRLYLLVYDITNARVYRKLYKILDSYVYQRIEKSVLELTLTDMDLVRLRRQLGKLFPDDEEKIILIPVCRDDQSKVRVYGAVCRESVSEPDFIML